MKSLIIILIVCFATPAMANFYIVDNENRVVSHVQYLPDQADLDAREEIAVPAADYIPLSDAEYRGGRIVTRVKSVEDKAEEVRRNEIAQERQWIEDKLQAIAITELKAEGKVFKHLDKGGQ